LAAEQKKADRRAALEFLRNSKDKDATKAIPALTKCLEDKDADIRGDACVALAEIAFTNKLACPLPLLEALFDPVEDVRLVAVTWVDVYKDYPDKALKLLLCALTCEDPNVRSLAPTTLGRIGDKNKEVLAALRKATEDKDARVRHNAFVALYGIDKDFAAWVHHLLEVLGGPVEMGDEKPSDSKDMKILRTAVNLIAIGSAVRLQELAKEQPAKLAPILIKLLADKSPYIRAKAARMLGVTAMTSDDAKAMLKELKADKALLKLVDDPDEEVRAEVKMALKRIED
jgi:HEAT repeat protein